MKRAIGAELPLEQQFDLHLQVMVDQGCRRPAYDKFARTHGRKLASIAGRWHYGKARTYHEASDMSQVVLLAVWALLQTYEYRCSVGAEGERCQFRTRSVLEWEAHVVVAHGGDHVMPLNDVGRYVRINLRRALIKEIVKVSRNKRFTPELWDDSEALERASGGYEDHLDDRVDAHTILGQMGADFGEESRDVWALGLVERKKVAKGKQVTTAARKFAEAV